MVDNVGKNRVRVIAGKWRGRRIDFSAIPGLRPTHDRVRETLFNWLSPFIIGSFCLDLFAGSGALGFEAASRGAKHVTMFDTSSSVVSMLEKNRAALNAENITVIHGSSLVEKTAFSKHLFDIVFLDPPFAQGLIQQTAERLEMGNYLSDEALIYIECEKDFGPPAVPTNWQELRAKKTGSLAYFLFKRVVN